MVKTLTLFPKRNAGSARLHFFWGRVYISEPNIMYHLHNAPSSFICGVTDSRFETRKETRKLVRELFGKLKEPEYSIEDCCLQECNRVGSFKKDYPRNIFVRFLKFDDKEVLLNCKNDLRPEIIVKNDYPPDIVQLNRMLGPVIEAAKGTSYEGRVKIRHGVLQIDNKFFKYMDLMSIPPEIDIAINCRIISSVYGSYVWFGCLHGFSNFHPTPVEVNGVLYKMIEQFIQAEKCRLFKDKDTLHEVMNSHNPIEMKNLGKKVSGFNEDKWKIKASEVAYVGCAAKFREYPVLGQVLMKTHPLTLAEATGEKPWGCGKGLKDPGVSDPKNWKQQGIMGVTLERVRSELIQDFGLPRSAVSGASLAIPPPSRMTLFGSKW